MYWVMYCYTDHVAFTVPCEKSKIFSFTSLVMKNIAVLPAPRWFPVKLICWSKIAFGSASGACYLVKSIAIIS